MTRSILWIEGLDLDETMFDTGKLSVIRGASRAYEEMPYIVSANFPGSTVIALGASMIGLIVDQDRASLAPQVDKLMLGFTQQGLEPGFVQNAVTDTTSPDLGQYAPLAHLCLKSAVVEIAAPGHDAEIALAIEQARAAVRVAQLREPGVRHRFSPNGPDPAVPASDQCAASKRAGVPDQPCAWDGTRPAEVFVAGPPTPDDEKSGKKFSCYPVSRSTGARWQFGRALRQRLYADARSAYAPNGCPPLAFVDDFHEMVQKEEMKLGSDTVHLPRLWEQGKPGALPVSAVNKIALFNADGDKFTGLRQRLKDALGTADGQQVFSIVLEHKMRALLTELVGDLVRLRDLSGALTDGALDARAAVSLPYVQTKRHGIPRDAVGLKDGDRLLRFETLLFGGDDTLFVVPCWLGWWLATRFFEITNGWTFDHASLTAAFAPGSINERPQNEIDALATKLDARRGTGPDDPFALRFSAGLVFADRKAPIRALKTFAHDLMTQAKAEGGLEVEVLESLEPPEGGLRDFRDRLFGADWLANRGQKDEHSRLTIPRNGVAAQYGLLAKIWCGKDATPAGPLHQALRAARGVNNLAGPVAADAARRALEASAERSSVTPDVLSQCALWPLLGTTESALRLHGILQQRDYVRAGAPWIHLMANASAQSGAGSAP